MPLETVSTSLSYGGTQGVYSHTSSATGTDMTFSVFVPPYKNGTQLPILWYLSGLTCTHSNVTEKAGFQRLASESGLIIVAPDTSPRGDEVPDDDTYDFGKGAGFYVDATQEPWSKHFKMRSYIEQELPEVIASNFPADMNRQGITGHSMGGHGALTIALRNPATYKSVSAFSPIVSPMNSPWGNKAFSGYLGTDKNSWREYDACALIDDGARAESILIDQGEADDFVESQLRSHLLQEACDRAAIKLTLNIREGYDHSYYFISTFMENHLRWHAERL